MAQTVHATIISNGETLNGESTQVSLERENTIECFYFEDAVRTAREKSTGQATGRRTYEPLVIRKRIDKSSPLLARSLCNNEVIEGTFRFYRPNPDGDGSTEQFFTVHIQEGRIASIKRISPDTFDPAKAEAPPLEEIAFVFHTIRWTYERDGIEHEDNWKLS